MSGGITLGFGLGGWGVDAGWVGEGTREQNPVQNFQEQGKQGEAGVDGWEC